MQSNDLFEFINSSIDELEREYNRLQSRVREDPGTAGDEGEENWATTLRNWLPSNYHVKTKGRIINPNGKASKQLDVIVLLPSYPKHLLCTNKKLYLSGGVIAAFECKLTLKAEHIKKAVECGVELKRLYGQRSGTLYRELNNPIIYGVLAHSHSWKQINSSPIENIENTLLENDLKFVKHPREMLDIVCVANLAHWSAMKNIWFSTAKNMIIAEEEKQRYIKELEHRFGPDGTIQTVYGCHSKNHPAQQEHFTPIGSMLTHLLYKIAFENKEIRSIADHFSRSNLLGAGIGSIRSWNSAILTEKVRNQVLANGTIHETWNDWNTMGNF